MFEVSFLLVMYLCFSVELGKLLVPFVRRTGVLVVIWLTDLDAFLHHTGVHGFHSWCFSI